MEPKYVIIKNNLIQDIQAGLFKPGDKVYSEGELKKMYHVSSTTVVKALNDLVSERYIIRRQGEGSFVRRDVKRKTVFYTEAFNPKSVNAYRDIIEKTHTFITEPHHDPNITTLLSPDDNSQQLTLITQVLTFNGLTWKVQLRYVLSHRLDEAAKKRLRNGASLSTELNLPTNLISLAHQTEINIAYLSEAPAVLQLLTENNLSFQHSERAYFKICRLSCLNDGEPIEYEISYIQPEHYTIRIEA